MRSMVSVLHLLTTGGRAMKKLLTSAVAVIIGAVWILGPAAAQTTAPSTSDKVGDKADAKSESTMDKVKDKTRSAVDKVKEKTVETKDKVVNAVKKAGAKNEQANVRAAQQALHDQGFDPGPVDGRMGPRTSSALRDYQTKQGLTATGQLDDATMDKLGVRSASAASPSTEPQTTQPSVQKPKQSP